MYTGGMLKFGLYVLACNVHARGLSVGARAMTRVRVVLVSSSSHDS